MRGQGEHLPQNGSLLVLVMWGHVQRWTGFIGSLDVVGHVIGHAGECGCAANAAVRAAGLQDVAVVVHHRHCHR
jgi:hypothetical protein